MFDEEGAFDVARSVRRRNVLRRLVDEYRIALFGAWGQELSRSRIAALRSSTDSALREIRQIERNWRLHAPGSFTTEDEPKQETGT